jgi:hypothetical protein
VRFCFIRVIGLVRLVEKPAGFGWFNSILWERISWNKPKHDQQNRAIDIHSYRSNRVE